MKGLKHWIWPLSLCYTSLPCGSFTGWTRCKVVVIALLIALFSLSCFVVQNVRRMIGKWLENDSENDLENDLENGLHKDRHNNLNNGYIINWKMHAWIMQEPCRSHAGAMQEPCKSHARAMQEPCKSHARAMQELCRSHAFFLHFSCNFPLPCPSINTQNTTSRAWNSFALCL